jgi:sulfate adenylyltransferase subunit 1
VQYTRNTVTGSSTADVVVLLVDARKGVLEQTRRHLAVTALLRVPHVVVAVNKIDLVDFSQEIYKRVEGEVQAVARELGVVDAQTIPVSALDGDNIVDRSERTPWYAGPSLLELLEELPPSDDPDGEAFRLPVQLVIRPQAAAIDEAHRDYRGFAGQVASGVVRVGDEVVALPSGRRTTVAGIDLGPTELTEAFAGQSVTLRLADEIDISRGDVIAAAADAPEPTQDIEAVVCWLGDAPLRPGQRLLLKHGSRTVQAFARAIEGALDLDDLHAVPAEALALNDIGRVTLRLATPVPVENYSVSRRGGAFLLIDGHDGRTLAAGMVGATLPSAAPAPSEPEGAEEWDI